MPLQNRVLPTGEIVAIPQRGEVTGNRGILHDDTGSLGVARWRHKHWLTCTLTHPKGRYHGPMPDRGWSALFFLDEAVALAAGHRPCHYCRRDAALAFRTAYETAHGPVQSLHDIDTALHAARVTRRRAQVRYQAEARDLPAGCFVLTDQPLLLLADQARGFGPAGYGPPIPRPRGTLTVLTPAPTVACLTQGFVPLLHSSLGTDR